MKTYRYYTVRSSRLWTPTLKSIDRPNSAGGHSAAMTYSILQYVSSHDIGYNYGWGRFCNKTWRNLWL